MNHPNSPELCEVQKQNISVWIDSELDHQSSLSAIDHLVDCPSCQEFYRRARALDAVARSETLSLGVGEEPSQELWQGILAATEMESRPKQIWGGKVWTALAAVLLLTVGFSLVRPQDSSPPSLEIVLGEARGQMSEARFLSLTAELLRADRRYQQKMLEVMLTVDEHLDRHEISDDETVLPRDESDGGAEDDEQRHRV